MRVSAVDQDIRVRRRRDEDSLFQRYAASREPTLRDALVERFLPLVRCLARRDAHGVQADGRPRPGRLDGPPQRDRALRPQQRDRLLKLRRAHTILGAINYLFCDRTWSLRVPRGSAKSSPSSRSGIGWGRPCRRDPRRISPFGASRRPRGDHRLAHMTTGVGIALGALLGSAHREHHHMRLHLGLTRAARRVAPWAALRQHRKMLTRAGLCWRCLLRGRWRKPGDCV